MEKLKQYHRGEWSDIELPCDYAPTDKDWEFDKYLEALGFHSHPSQIIGNTDGYALSFHDELNQGRRVYVEFTNGGSCENFLLLDTFDELLFLKEFGAPIALSQVQFQLEVLLEIGEKTFRSEHGHDPTNCCQQCDPREWQRWQEARARRAEAAKNLKV